MLPYSAPQVAGDSGVKSPTLRAIRHDVHVELPLFLHRSFLHTSTERFL